MCSAGRHCPTTSTGRGWWPTPTRSSGQDLSTKGVDECVVDDRVVGFATTTIAVAEDLELDDLFVDPEWMRRGIARALVADAAAIARGRQIRRIVVTANEHALGFYERQGFVTDGVVETRFGPVPRMHLELAPEVESSPARVRRTNDRVQPGPCHADNK
jgi:GNAT superfamily N-acetyltransferase